jgi:hypothetical protein
MKNNLFILLFLLTGANFSHAQIIFGVRAGVNLADVNGKSEGESTNEFSKMIAGLNLGATADINLNDNFYFQPGLSYSGKGFRLKRSVDFLNIDATTTLNYLEVPLNFGYKAGSFHIFAGPYVAFALSGKIKVGDESEKIKFGNNEEEDYLKGTDVGLNVGLGYQIKNFMISAQYGLGFTNLVINGDSDNTARNQVIGFSLGYEFPKKQ